MKNAYTGLYIDTETGGYDPNTNALTSICVGHFTLTKDRRPELETIVLPICPAMGFTVTADAARVQGKSVGTLYCSGEPESKQMEALSYWLWNGGRIYSAASTLHALPVWAHNADFDRGFLSAACGRYFPDWRKAEPHQLATNNLAVCTLAGRDARWSCTRCLAEYLVQKRRLEMPRKPDGTGSVSLDPLLERLGIPGRTGGHDAEEDVRLGVAVLDALLRLDGWWD